MSKKPIPKPLKELTCTGTHSQVLKRLGYTSIRRMLDDPVNLTYQCPDNYALVWNEDYGIYIVRFGVATKPQAVEYTLACCLGYSETHKGPAGRDHVIEKFLRMLKKGKSYHKEYPDQYAKRAEPPPRSKTRRRR